MFAAAEGGRAAANNKHNTRGKTQRHRSIDGQDNAHHVQGNNLDGSTSLPSSVDPGEPAASGVSSPEPPPPSLPVTAKGTSITIKSSIMLAAATIMHLLLSIACADVVSSAMAMELGERKVPEQHTHASREPDPGPRHLFKFALFKLSKSFPYSCKITRHVIRRPSTPRARGERQEQQPPMMGAAQRRLRLLSLGCMLLGAHAFVSLPAAGQIFCRPLSRCARSLSGVQVLRAQTTSALPAADSFIKICNAKLIQVKKHCA